MPNACICQKKAVILQRKIWGRLNSGALNCAKRNKRETIKLTYTTWKKTTRLSRMITLFR